VTPSLADGLRRVMRALADGFWTLAGWGLDFLRDIGALGSLLVVVVVSALVLAVARSMQRELVARLKAQPAELVPIWLLELRTTLPALVVRPLLALARAVGGLFGRKKGKRKGGPRAGADKAAGAATAKQQAEPDREAATSSAAAEAPEHPPDSPAGGDGSDEPTPDGASERGAEEGPEPDLLVATLGPSYMLAAWAAVGLFLLGWALEPVLRARWGLSPGFSAWQYLFFGQRPETQWYLPLDRFPYLGGLLTWGFWLTVWWWLGRVVRLVLGSTLGANLIAYRSAGGRLELWRRWLGAPELHAPAPSFVRWARWLAFAGLPLLVPAWVALGGEPYRAPASAVALAALGLLSWGLLLLLKGMLRTTPAAAAEPEREAVQEGNGWHAVLRDLRQVGGATPASASAAYHRVPALELAAQAAAEPNLVSPLLGELLPEPGQLTTMQQRVLADLSLAVGPSADAGATTSDLSLASSATVVQPDGTRPHHQVVLAPEAWGKTTLGLLAACNTALLHTRASLVVVRTPARAEELVARLRAAVQPSTLRWTLRVRLAGEDLIEDLAQGIPPDVVVCDLAALVGDLLDTPAAYDLLLRRVGLVVLDDAESFCGPVEVHAQLALRRLLLRLRTLQQQLGRPDDNEAPQVLALGCASMHDPGTWLRTLCGVDAQVRTFGPAAPGAAPFAAQGAGDAPVLAATAPAGPHQRLYRLQDFRTTTGEPLRLLELIAACERLEVPWHYRVCGDGRRDQGREALLLPEEPRWATDDPTHACVVLLGGPLADIRRERRRLVRAGANFSRFTPARPPEAPEPIALVTAADPDEEVGLTQLDRSSGLATLVDTLPRPILRAPAGRALAAHLASELSEHWVEVADLVSVFGHGVASLLARLAQQDLLLAESRTDLRRGAQRYEPVLYLRVPARALGSEALDDDDQDASSAAPGALLPPKVGAVELASDRAALLRDRTRLGPLGRVDADSALLAYYPGRIFSDARGRFVVVRHVLASEGRERPGRSSQSAGRVGEVLVEPLQADDHSSPRRRLSIRRVEEQSGDRPSSALAAREPGGVRRLLLGAHPIGADLGLAVVRCASHVATLRLGPLRAELRQCSLADDDLQETVGAAALSTEALWVYPCPPRAGGLPPGPGLTLGAARLLASAVRLLLPSVVRGAERELGVALQLVGDRIDATTPLGVGDALVFYDLQPGGSGACRSLQRDGLEAVLRLARALLERVVDTRRLLALYDQWGDADELLRQRAASHDPRWAPTGEGDPLVAAATLRREILTWLDSRLSAELQPPASSSVGPLAGPVSGSEPGEGDPRDLGRCWYSADGQTDDLVWTKHLWLLSGDEPVTLDVGFDRNTAAEARQLTEHPGALAAYRRQLDELRGEPRDRATDGTARSQPRALWLPPGPTAEEPLATDRVWEQEPGVLGFQALAVALARHAWEPLEPLAHTLMERCGARAEASPAERMRLAQFCARFVQGIPYSVPAALASGLRPPVATLLYRLGDCDSKSLLLAVLLQHCGIDAGLMISVPDRHAVAAAVVALPEDVEASLSPAPAYKALTAWAAKRGLAAPPRAWAALPPGNDAEPGAKPSLYVPLETTSYEDVGQVRLPRPETWVFVPLPHLARRVALRPELTPEDRREHEEGAP